MSHHFKCGACGERLAKFAGVGYHVPVNGLTRAICAEDGSRWPCIKARVAHIRDHQTDGSQEE